MHILPVLLSGGAGSRLWPLSRALYPKQLHALVGEETPLQQTATRLAGLPGLTAPLAVCNEAHRFPIAEQLRAAGVAPAALLLEPEGRGTAAAAAAAALHAVAAASEAGEPLLLLLPCDHFIAAPQAFRAAVERALPAAAGGALVAFGVAPTRAETGYGYIEIERAGEQIAPIKRFVEKPDRATALRYLESGRHLWNSGIFLFRPSRYLEALRRFAPAIVECVAQSVRDARAADRVNPAFVRLGAAAFCAAPADSIDCAVMERTDAGVVARLDAGWSDIGSWDALWALAPRDADDNVALGDTLLDDSVGCYVRAESRLVAVIGARDLIVVESDDAVLAAPRARAQEVKQAVERLRAAGRAEALHHRRVHRPWGWYQRVDGSEADAAGQKFQVKRIRVEAGRQLSLQRHRRRAEHWVVVRGRARVVRDDESLTLEENEAVHIPLGATHRLENPGPGPLEIIEVQVGDYLGEDDIERFEDLYGRD